MKNIKNYIYKEFFLKQILWMLCALLLLFAVINAIHLSQGIKATNGKIDTLLNLNQMEIFSQLRIAYDGEGGRSTGVDVKNIQKGINNRQFVNSKIDGNYRKCLSMLINPKTNIFNIKNLAIFFSPVILLKKILWYHQD